MGTPRQKSRPNTEGEFKTELSEKSSLPVPSDWARPVVRSVRPQVDGGARAAKTTVGELLRVAADAFVDGHDCLWVEARYRHASSSKWDTVPMRPLYDDRWLAELPVRPKGLYRFSVRARVDHFATWRRELAARAEAGQDLTTELVVGAELIDAAALHARAGIRRLLAALAEAVRTAVRGLESDVTEELARWAEKTATTRNTTLSDVLFSERVGRLMGELADPGSSTTSPVYSVLAESAKARFSTWYEMFPRSASSDQGRHGTFADVRARLDYVEHMGFDVLYLPPIHPIGLTARKGRDGTTSTKPGDPGSPWAIGAADGGHTSVHPDLGTMRDFEELVADAGHRGIDVAIDLAFQASPDHPWVHEHPEWFRHRPDGTIRYAENPPKRYEDIFPFDFATSDWRGLWTALLDVVRFWVGHGVKVFRVDNPHTKPFAFWEWLLASIRSEAPDLIFLSEAFTRPRVMEHLARIGFTQSYTYFTWRTTKWELETYMTELTQSDVADYFRPNLWPNTPDILSEELQSGGRAVFLSRLVLAATLSSSYGIYGPAFELREHLPRNPGSEEYLRSEKYEVRSWDLESPLSLAPFIGLVNRIRRDHVALQFNDTLAFHHTDNDQIIAYSKVRAASAELDVVVVIVSLDHLFPQSGWVTLDLHGLGIAAGASYVMHDLLTDARYVWEGSTNFVKLDPDDVPCHIFSVSQPSAANSTSAP
jgi:starch synthase (maltosyl-transferring)